MKARLYVPAPGTKLGIDPLAGIVGRYLRGNRGPLELYYEGNRYGYANVQTYADRVMIAAGRLSRRYPTVARQTVWPDDVNEVGEYDTETRRIVVVGGYVPRLAAWLELVPPTIRKLKSSGELEVSSPLTTYDPTRKRWAASCPSCDWIAVRVKREAAEWALAQHRAYNHEGGE